MKRRLLNIASASSLLLCAGTAVMWVRSYHVQPCDNWYPRTSESEYLIVVQPGRLFVDRKPGRQTSDGFYYDSAPDFFDGFRGWRHRGIDPNRSDSSWSFGYGEVTTASGTREWVVVVPLWSIIGILLVFPLMLVRKYLRQHTRPGTCVTCGYDLRATPERCPECGTVPKINKA